MQTRDRLKVALRRQELRSNGDGRQVWESVTVHRELDPGSSALILCDVWDDHWCRAAVDRLESLIPRMSRVVDSARNRGVLIIHAPSETMEFYEGSPARRRALDSPVCELPVDLSHEEPRLPIDDSDGGCDAADNPHPPNERKWNRQHAGIVIDEERDAVTDDGAEVFRLLRADDRRYLFIMGVHTNKCILNRSFAIKQMVRWGVDINLVRDLTDSIYSPARAPYVSHQEGTHLMVDYIEKFWCPSVESEAFLA